MKKLHPIRIIVFFISVLALARFFEAGRIIANEQTFTHMWTSLFSFLILVLTLFFMGYWIYIEEKEKNNLKIKFGLYEWIYKKIRNKEVEKQRGKKVW